MLWKTCLLAPALALIAATCAGQPAGWKAGVAKAVITPKGPIWMAGFAARKKPSEGVLRDLYVKALALQDGTGRTSVLVTADLESIDRGIGETIAARCEKKYGLARDRLVLNVSHTHSAPVTRLAGMPGWYDMDEEQADVVRRYTRGLLDQVVDVVGASLRDLSPASLSFGQGLAGIAVNRRRVRSRGYPGPVDPDVPVLAVRAPDGELRAVVAGYACHATALSEYQISGDWPGFAQGEIEKAHPGATALFVQGCGADANALPRRTVELARNYGKILAAAVDLVLNANMRPVAGPLRTAFERVDVPFHHPPTRAELEEMMKSGGADRRRQLQHLLDELDRDGKLPGHYPYPVQVWQFEGGLKFIALGGEVVADYALRLKARHGWENTWVAGYSNDVFAYIPSRRVLEEGGYEGGEANWGDGLPGPFGAAIEEIIVEKVSDLVARTAPQ